MWFRSQRIWDSHVCRDLTMRSWFALFDDRRNDEYVVETEEALHLRKDWILHWPPVKYRDKMSLTDANTDYDNLLRPGMPLPEPDVLVADNRPPLPTYHSDDCCMGTPQQ